MLNQTNRLHIWCCRIRRKLTSSECRREYIFAVMNMSSIPICSLDRKDRRTAFEQHACQPGRNFVEQQSAMYGTVRFFSYPLDIHGPLYSSNKNRGANAFSCMYQCMVASMQPIVRQDIYASLHTLLNLFLVEYNCTTVHGSEATHSSTATKFQSLPLT
jgi:hypothetical protein